jgi:hypothetical protein
MQDTHDPFSYLLNEIRAHDAGLREDWDPYQRDHYLETLLIEEAQEIAWGRRHLTVIHGPVLDDVVADLLDELFVAWEEVASRAQWGRIGGGEDSHLTLAIADPQSDRWMDLALDAVAATNPGTWRSTVSAWFAP